MPALPSHWAGDTWACQRPVPGAYPQSGKLPLLRRSGSLPVVPAKEGGPMTTFRSGKTGGEKSPCTRFYVYSDVYRFFVFPLG